MLSGLEARHCKAPSVSLEIIISEAAFPDRLQLIEDVMHRGGGCWIFLFERLLSQISGVSPSAFELMQSNSLCHCLFPICQEGTTVSYLKAGWFYFNL